MVPSQNRILQIDRCGHYANLVETRITLRAEHQCAPIGAFVAIIYKHGIDFVAV